VLGGAVPDVVGLGEVLVGVKFGLGIKKRTSRGARFGRENMMGGVFDVVVVRWWWCIGLLCSWIEMFLLLSDGVCSRGCGARGCTCPPWFSLVASRVRSCTRDDDDDRLISMI